MKIIELSTDNRCQFVDITAQVQALVSDSNMASGAVVVCSTHTTAGITMNENADPDVVSDVLATLARLAPRRGDYSHGEGNSDAHIKASLVGFSVTVPVENGGLSLGVWQAIYFCEFDGPRRRRALVQFLPSP